MSKEYEIRKKLLDCIESGNFSVAPGAVANEYGPA